MRAGPVAPLILLAASALSVQAQTTAGSQAGAPTQTPVYAPVPSGTGTLAFINVNVIPMDRERVLEGQTVIVTGERITALGPSSTVTVPDGAIRIDGRGRYLMPGLADMHGHLSGGDGALNDGAGRQLALYLAHGVTTMRSLSGSSAGVALRERVRQGELLGPHLIVYSSSLNANSVPDAASVDSIVAAHAAAGVDGLKIHGGFDAATYDSVIAAARRVNLPVSGHITPGYGLHRALAAGQQIEHLDGFIQALLPESYDGPPAGQIVASQAILSQVDTSRLPALARMVAERGIWNGPTVALFELVVADSTAEQLLARPNMRYVPEAARTAWANQRTQMQGGAPPADVRNSFVQLRRAIVRALHDAGAKLLVGSDSPQMFMTPGDAVHREIEAFVTAGVPPYAALEAATRNAAEYLGALDDFGTVAVGRRADLVLLDANPLADISNIRRVSGVAVGGRWLGAADLTQLREQLAGMVAGS